MVKVTYNKQLTALLVIDPYNDFISEGGKIWDRIHALRDGRYDKRAHGGPGTCRSRSIPGSATNRGNGRSPLPSRESTKSAHTSHVPAKEMTK
jgi:hypothetical protein